MGSYTDNIRTVSIEAVWSSQEPPRLIQIFDNGDVCDEWCIHGIKLRWSCDKCENIYEVENDK